MSFINPIDLTLSLFIIAIAIFGIKNGCIIEIKKTSNLLLSIILSKILITYTPIINIQGQLIISIIFFSSLALLLFVIGFIIDMGIYRLPLIKIDKEVDKAGGGIVAIIKSLLIICIFIFAFQTSPIQIDIKDKILSRASSTSMIFKFSNNRLK